MNRKLIRNKVELGLWIFSVIIMSFVIFSFPQFAFSQEQPGPQEEFNQCQQLPFQKSVLENAQNHPSTTLAPYLAIEAFYENSPRLCSSLTNEQDRLNCLDLFYLLTNQCDNISKNFKKWICFSLNTTDTSICPQTPAEKPYCEALFTNNSSICKTEKSPAGCLNAFNFKSALSSKNIELCDRINTTADEVSYLACIVKLAPKSEKTLAEVNLSYKTNVCNELYSSHLARVRNDPSICTKIPFHEGRNRPLFQSCLAQFSIKNLKE